MLGRPAIFDMGSGMNLNVVKLQAEMTRLIIVVEPNPVCVNMAREMIQEMENEGAGVGRINIVVMNRAQSSLQTPWNEIEQALGREIKAIISAAPELAFQSMQNAIPLVLLQPNAIVTGQFNKLAEALKPGIKSIAGGLLTS
jgi:MinD-like ATPase involved in chromosome partitioning or flagellar assembly